MGPGVPRICSFKDWAAQPHVSVALAEGPLTRAEVTFSSKNSLGVWFAVHIVFRVFCPVRIRLNSAKSSGEGASQRAGAGQVKNSFAGGGGGGHSSPPKLGGGGRGLP